MSIRTEDVHAPLTPAETAWLEEAVAYSGSGQPDLPGLPDLVTRMRRTMGEPDCTPAKLAALVGSDAAIGARVVKVANSAMARGAAPIHSLDRAIARLGFDLVRNLVTGICVTRLFTVPSGASAAFLRRHYRATRMVAAEAYALGRHSRRAEPQEALLAGLVHDIGVLPLLAYARKSAPPDDTDAALNRLLYQGHTRAGAALLEQWQFDERFVTVAAEHEDLLAMARDRHPLRDLLIVANVEVNSGPGTWIGQVDRNRVPAYRRLSIDPGGGFRGGSDWTADIEAAQLRMLGQ